MELNQEGLVEELKVPFGGIWGRFSRKMDCGDREKIKSKYKDLDKRKGKGRVDLKIKLANLKVIVYLQVLSFVFTAAAWVFRIGFIFLISRKFHPTI